MKPEKVIRVTMTRRIPLKKKTCPQCGQSFLGPKLRKYCSNSCSYKATYQKYAERYRALRRERYQQEKAARQG